MSRFALGVLIIQTLLVQNLISAPGSNVIPGFKTLAHGLRSGKVTILGPQTLHIKSLFYDGAAPDAYFLVGKGAKPNAVGGVKVPNEKGSYAVLEGYEGQDVTLTLPGSITVRDIDWLSVYCISFRENFGHVTIPSDVAIPGEQLAAADEEVLETIYLI